MDNHSTCRHMLKLMREDAKTKGVSVPKNITAIRSTSRLFFVEADGVEGVTIEGECAADAKANYISALVDKHEAAQALEAGNATVEQQETAVRADIARDVPDPLAKPYDTTSNLIAYEQGELEEEDTIELFQNLINTGMAWMMQGSIGRQAMALIESGDCLLGEVGHKDYYGNYVPSRYEVKPGTKGSIEYAQNLKGGK